MNNFCLWSIFVRSASVRHPFEPHRETHTGASPPLSPNPHPTTYTPPDDADLPFVRHQRISLADNPLTMNPLSLGAHKHQNSGLVRHRAIATAPRLSHNPHPTTYNPPSCPTIEEP